MRAGCATGDNDRNTFNAARAIQRQAMKGNVQITHDTEALASVEYYCLFFICTGAVCDFFS